jgi:hypothetical protein
MFLTNAEVSHLPPELQNQRVALQRINFELMKLDQGKQRWMEAQDFHIKEQIARHVTSRQNFDDLVHGIARLKEIRSLPPPHDPTTCARLISELVFGHGPNTLSLDPACAKVVRVLNPAHLKSLQGLAANLFSPAVDVRRATINALRQDDFVYTDLQGAIPAQAVKLNRNAISQLVQQIGPNSAMFSLARGGALLADHIENLMERGILNIRIPKILNEELIGPRRPDETRRDPWWIYQRFQDPQYRKEEHLRRFENAIRTFLTAHQGDPPTIVIAETLVGGGSANKVLEVANKILKDFPYIKVKILLERHSLHQDKPNQSNTKVVKFRPHAKTENFVLFADPSKGSLNLEMSNIKAPPHARNPNFSSYNPTTVQRAEVVISDAEYIIAEDVNYQLMYEGQDTHQPVFVFKEDLLGTVRAVCLMPSGSMTARDILQLLIKGAYDYVLYTYGVELRHQI